MAGTRGRGRRRRPPGQSGERQGEVWDCCATVRVSGGAFKVRHHGMKNQQAMRADLQAFGPSLI